MTWKYRYRKQIVIGILFLLLIGVGLTIYILQKDTKKEKTSSDILLTKEETSKKKTKEQEEKKVEKIMVDIKGEVVNPGIYTLEENARVIDVITMAGGTTENADTSVLNLSKKVKDEMVIIVYSYYEVKNFSYIKEVEQKVQTSCSQGINDIENDACIESKEESSTGLVSINTATKEELMTLPGIGEKKAEDIIKYREENGNFTAIEDIKNVSGIGDSLFDKIKESITL